MIRGTHTICDRCWTKREGRRLAARAAKPRKQSCCFCGDATRSGIFVAADWDELTCGGDHPPVEGVAS